MKISGNVLKKIKPVYSNVTKRIEKTPKWNILGKHKILNVAAKPKYQYSKCGEEINNYLDQYYGICNDGFINEEPRYLNATHYEIREALANSYGSWAVNGNLIGPTKDDYGQYFWHEFFDMYQGNILYEVNELILTGFVAARTIFGHMMADLIAPILLLPKDVRERSYVVGSEKKYMNEYLNIIGFSYSRIIKIREKQWIYAHKLHVFNEKRSISSYNGYCVELLQKYFEDHFKLKSIEATRYCLLNRKSERGRIMDNFNDLMAATKKAFPDKRWEQFFEVKDIKETALNWASVRFVVQIDGSNCFNSIFMKKGTILCTGSSTHMDFCSAFFIIASHHYVYWFPVPGVDHINYKHCNISIDFAIDGIRKCLYCDKHGFFSSSLS